MNQTRQTLLEQMRVTETEIGRRMDLFALTPGDMECLRLARPLVEKGLEQLVDRFYELQTSSPEIALLIGDADTLARLRSAQRRYVLDLFSGVYDLDYVNNRLRIGLVHKRIGVEPKLYLAAVYTLKILLTELLSQEVDEQRILETTLAALEKLLMFDVTLVFDTYIRSLVTEIEIAKRKSDLYAVSLEDKVRERTRQLEELSRTDALTGLLNVRHLDQTLNRCVRRAERRREPVSLVYMDINDFKRINDTEGHPRGDEVLRKVGAAIRAVSRAEDSCFRYGGDEFCIILPNCLESQARDIYMRRLNDLIEQSLQHIVLSIGVVQTGPGHYLEPAELIREADSRMYAAKRKIKRLRGIKSSSG